MDAEQTYTCGYCGKVMTWMEHLDHDINEDARLYREKYPKYTGAVWLAMIMDTMRGIDLATNSSNIIYTNHYRNPL
jgi:hypothetical protein